MSAVAEEQTVEASPEKLALPRIDTEDIDRIEVAFSGTIRLDRSDPADVALFRRLGLGKKTELRVELTTAGKAGKITWDEDGYPGETTAQAKVKVTSLWRPVEDGGPDAKLGSGQAELALAE